MAVLNPVDKFYRSVMEEVLLECREMFLDDGVDEIVLTELKQMWEKKVKQSKVFEFTNLHGNSGSFGMGSYGIISSSRSTTCPEILVPSIHLAGPRGNGVNNNNNNYTPTATIALPYGLYQQQISALNSAGISLQPSGNGQFLAFIRPDQQRLQSLTTPQGLHASGKIRPIIVSTTQTVPIRPGTANLNLPLPNRVSTALPAKGMPDLKKQNILPAQTGFIGKVPSGNIVIKGAGNLGYSNPVNQKINSGGSSVITINNNLNGSAVATNSEPAKTNSSIPNNNTKTVPIPVNTNYNIMNNADSLKTVSNTSVTNSNSLVGNNSNVGTFSPPVNTNTTTNTFNASQNTYPPPSASSSEINANTVSQKQTDNNSSLEALANGYGNPPVTNSYSSNAGFYNDNTNSVVNTRAQTEGMGSVPNTPASLEDFMDNITNSNSEPYSYPTPQSNTLVTEGILSSDFNSSVHDNSSSNTYNTQSFPGSTTGTSLPTNYKPTPSGGDAVPGQMCRFSEEDMQTLDEILQFDGAGDEYSLDKKITTPQHFYSFSPRRSSVENNVSYEVNNPNTTKIESETFYQNGKVSRETKNFNDQNTFSREHPALRRLKTGRALKTDSFRCDYVARKKNSSTRETLISPISTVSPDLNQNLTINDQEGYDLKTDIQKCGSSPKNKTSPLSARNVSGQTPMLTLNDFIKLQNLPKETRSGISVRALSSASNSSVNSDQVVPVIEKTSTINPGSPKHRIISKTAVDPPRGFGSFPICFPRQFDGEDADSSSSSDNNTNANLTATDEDDDDDEAEEPAEEVEDVAIESEPLNSADDDSDIDICAMFESENIVVCQFEKISRNKNKWKFHLKDGIMNLFGRDLIFSKSIGEAEW